MNKETLIGKKKFIILLDTDDFLIINQLKKEFLKEEITIIPKGIELWEVDENNHMERRI